MSLVRVNICIESDLADRLRKTNLNWSAIARAALARALSNESLEQENARLRADLRDLTDRLRKIKDLLP